MKNKENSIINTKLREQERKYDVMVADLATLQKHAEVMKKEQGLHNHYREACARFAKVEKERDDLATRSGE